MFHLWLTFINFDWLESFDFPSQPKLTCYTSDFIICQFSLHKSLNIEQCACMSFTSFSFHLFWFPCDIAGTGERNKLTYVYMFQIGKGGEKGEGEKRAYVLVTHVSESVHHTV